MRDYREFNKQVLDYVLKEGADDAIAYLYKSSGKFLEYRDNNIDTIKESIQNSLDIKIFLNGRYSVFSTSDLDETRIKNFIKNAVEATKNLSPDPYRKILPAEYYPKNNNNSSFQLRDESCLSVTPDNLLELASECASVAAKSGKNVISSASSVSVRAYEKYVNTSNGFNGVESGSMSSFSGEITIRDKDSRPEGWYSATSRFFNDLPSAQNMGETAANRALRKLNPVKVKSGKYTMVVENFAVSRLLSLLLEPLKAQAIHQKRSYLANKIGVNFASKALTIEDNPHIPKAPGSTMFNGEGLETKPFKVIENGILKNFYVDNYYGKKLQLEPTAYGTTNLVVKKGEKNLSELISGIKQGIFVTEFLGGNANPATGNFSLGIYGQLIENGELTSAVKEMNITDNGLDFWNKLIDIGSDAITHSSIIRPSMVFGDINFSGE